MGDYSSYQELYFPALHETSKGPLNFGNSKFIEVRLSLLEHHVFHNVFMNAAAQLKSYDLTQPLLSGCHF